MALPAGFLAVALILIAETPCQIKAGPLGTLNTTATFICNKTKDLLNEYVNLNDLNLVVNNKSVTVTGINLSHDHRKRTACAFLHYLNSTLQAQKELNPDSNITDALTRIISNFQYFPVVENCQLPTDLENPNANFHKKLLGYRVLRLFITWLEGNRRNLHK